MFVPRFGGGAKCESSVAHGKWHFERSVALAMERNLNNEAASGNGEPVKKKKHRKRGTGWTCQSKKKRKLSQLA